MSRKANRVRKTTVRTAEGCTVETAGNEITLSTPKATVTPIRGDLSWLMADVLSTANGYRA